jgi:predicted HTH transcriptional regulator
MPLNTEQSYINNLIEQGEHQQLDFKFAINDSRKIAKSLVAFANTDGGRLLVGVKDNGVIVGVKTDEEYYMVEAAAEMYSQPSINFETKRWVVSGKTVLEVVIPKSDQMPHYAKDHDNNWLAYIRFKDQNLLANNVLLKVWQRKKSKEGLRIKLTHKEQFLIDYLSKNKTIMFSKFCRLAHIPGFKAEEILVNFILWDLIEMKFTEKTVYYQLKEEQSVR